MNIVNDVYPASVSCRFQQVADSYDDNYKDILIANIPAASYGIN